MHSSSSTRRRRETRLKCLSRQSANAGPREETVRLKYGGINVPKSVDTAPMRRVDSAIGFIAEAVLKSSRKSKKSASAILADELICRLKRRREVLLGWEKGRKRADCKIRPVNIIFFEVIFMARGKKTVERVVELMKDPKHIRNIGIVAHIDHGKTTLSDNLLAGAGIISEELAGKQLFMDSDAEEQARGITIDASTSRWSTSTMARTI